jgi:Bacterial Ig-like domain
MFNYRGSGRRWRAGRAQSATRSEILEGDRGADRLGRVLSAGLLLASVAGCSADVIDQPELRADGPPDVLAVLVARDRFLPSSMLLEEATYCRPNDSKRPGRVMLPLPNTMETDVCPTDVSQSVEMFDRGFPAFWYARIVFDELLDLESEPPSEEPYAKGRGELRVAETRNPVLLSCDGLPIAYNTFYTGEGNRDSWPVGPSLKLRPKNPATVPANALCEVTLEEGAIFDKTGVPPEQAQAGPYRFQIAPIGLQIPYGAASAAYGTTGAPPTLGPGNPPFRVNFNHYLKASSFTASDVKVFRDAYVNDPLTDLTECGGGVEVVAKVRPFELSPAQAGSIPAAMTIADDTVTSGDWAPGTQYRVEIGGAVEDVAGGGNALAPTTLCFRTR